ncbi:hypothetical protein Q3G72_016794 [Acer saccharum]|nr:hypothetical protein Q3G72_016794 [Acer saccharum]
MEIGFMQPRLKASASLMSSSFLGASSFFQNPKTNPFKPTRFFKSYRERRLVRRENIIVRGWLLVLPVDTCPWTLNIDSENNIASQLLSFLSLFPYMGFLYFISRSKSTPKLTLFGFYFLLAFVGAAVPAGLYAKVHYESQRCKARHTKCCSWDQRGEILHLGKNPTGQNSFISCSLFSFQMEFRMPDNLTCVPVALAYALFLAIVTLRSPSSILFPLKKYMYNSF